MLKLPLTEKDLEKIIEITKGSHPELYAKLWSYKMNYMNKEKKHGFS